ncbi:ABC transporter ATP-binding protein [Engelhardtia mirabilis]|uniref:Daunorubicin/doxorubicin resistance ATP-binding protein DrrA n=1 Tax=Engelhardtia mirabilis TaxID=2528011 RepID=A0A518BM86_9BACT|nr:Daunorubicin/doxorubicin resistance ATP-binding protein DrrA [Planctomycetes bacterium Pla133]QDV02418.1 Daunorubicin/doxorubicin resistance ATP-binding protein DrrA [Planctomycetes bacterium Pla86]
MTTTTQPSAPGFTGVSTSLRGLTRHFGDKIAVQPLDLDLEPGSIVGLIGPNGSGKSTLMRMVVGLLRPSGGSATVAGVRLHGDGTAVRARCTFAPGELGFYGELRCEAHLKWLLKGRERSSVARGIELLERLGLPRRGRVRSFSHGMKRQLLFAAALAPDVPLRILDEPTEGLDPSKRGEVMDLLREDASPGRTTLLSSHHLGEVDHSCDRLLFLSAGRLIADESAVDLAARARRLVRVEWPDEPPADLESAARSNGAVAVMAHGSRTTIELDSDDPRPILGLVAQRTDWPRPAKVEYGQLSLRELYRDLYGVEGL